MESDPSDTLKKMGARDTLHMHAHSFKNEVRIACRSPNRPLGETDVEVVYEEGASPVHLKLTCPGNESAEALIARCREELEDPVSGPLSITWMDFPIPSFSSPFEYHYFRPRELDAFEVAHLRLQPPPPVPKPYQGSLESSPITAAPQAAPTTGEGQGQTAGEPPLSQASGYESGSHSSLGDGLNDSAVVEEREVSTCAPIPAHWVAAALYLEFLDSQRRLLHPDGHWSAALLQASGLNKEARARGLGEAHRIHDALFRSVIKNPDSPSDTKAEATWRRGQLAPREFLKLCAEQTHTAPPCSKPPNKYFMALLAYQDPKVLPASPRTSIFGEWSPYFHGYSADCPARLLRRLPCCGGSVAAAPGFRANRPGQGPGTACTAQSPRNPGRSPSDTRQTVVTTTHVRTPTSSSAPAPMTCGTRREVEL